MTRLSNGQMDNQFQNEILQDVSRTFALTIPQLPLPLYRAVANAYLLCRIADTIEDDSKLTFQEKKHYCAWFANLVKENDSANDFGLELEPKLGPHATKAERILILNSDIVLRITHSLSPTQRDAMLDCIQTMTKGMVLYQGEETLNGLENQKAMDLYCYYVAGVVGEMLTRLFLEYGHDWEEASKEKMLNLSTSFGQGLQMTNILKDMWTDRERGACWIPGDIFENENINLSKIKNGRISGFENCLSDLLGTALSHLRNALQYTLSVPKNERGIRLFCLWALFMAVLTLRKIRKDKKFLEGETVKISRLAVFFTMWSTTILSRFNTGIKFLFLVLSARLPKKENLVNAVRSTEVEVK